MRSIIVPAFCTLSLLSVSAFAQHDMTPPTPPPPMSHGAPPAAAASAAPPPMMHGQPQPAAAAASVAPPMMHGTPPSLPPPMTHGSPPQPQPAMGGMGGMGGGMHGMATVDAGPPPPDPVVVAAADPTEQARIRGEYVKRTNSQIRTVVLVNNKAVSADEQKAITTHWHDSMYLLRIREVAAADNNKVAVSRCDEALDATDQKFYSKLKSLNAQAPAATPATP